MSYILAQVADGLDCLLAGQLDSLMFGLKMRQELQ